MITFTLPPQGSLTPNNDVDPLRFYYKPVVGRIFCARLQLGLDLFTGSSQRLLEVGYGSGLLMPTLARATSELYGVDLEREPPGLRAALSRLGAVPKELVQADIRRLPFPDAYFDCAVAFSILEHLKSHELGEALSELARVLAPGGQLLVGCPAVHPAMNLAFAAIGFSGIENHHFSSIRDVVETSARDFRCERIATWPGPLRRLPLGLAPYTAVRLRRLPLRK